MRYYPKGRIKSKKAYVFQDHNYRIAWKTIRGEIIKWKDLETSHLSNIYNMLKRDHRFKPHALKYCKIEIERRAKEMLKNSDALIRLLVLYG